MHPPGTQPEFTLLYDGSCPICAWEKRSLVRRDKHGKLAFIDIQAPGFDPAQYGTTMAALMGRLHGFTPKGQMIAGVETVIKSYRAVGWWWVYLPLSMLPRPLVDKGYQWFANNRYAISRRFGRFFGPTCDLNLCRDIDKHR